MDHAQLDNNSPARASLLGMPLEIKMTIVRMARDQDARYRAARRTDELAAVWLFESNRVLHSTFQYLVAGRRACHVRSLYFEDGPAGRDATLESVAYILSRGVTFSKLSQIIIKPSSILSLLLHREGAAPRDELKTTYVRTHFRTMAARIRRVVLIRLSADDATDILDYFPRLQDIELAQADDSDRLRDALSARVELRSFTLRYEMTSVTRTWSEWHWTPAVSLTSLTFEVFRISQNDLDFVEGFAESLKRLELKCEEVGADVEDAIDLDSTFPHLHTLVLKTPLGAFTMPLLLCLSAPKLKSLSFATDRSDDNLDIEFADDSFLMTALQRSTKSLRSLELLPPVALFASERDLLTTFCAKNHLTLSDVPSCGIPFNDFEGGEYNNDEDDSLGWRAAAERTLVFGASHLERLSLDGDQIGLTQLLRALGGLEAARILWKE